MLTRKRKPTCIGLDLGAGGARAAQLLSDGAVYVVTAAGRFDAGDHSPTDSTGSAATAAQVATCLKTARFHGRAAVGGISTPDLEFHPLELPAAALGEGSSRRELVVAAEMERLATQIDGPMEARSWLLPRAGASAPTAIGVASPRTTPTHAAESCRGAGLFCTRVAPTATALAHFAGQLRAADANEITGILDLGLRQSRLILCVDAVPVLIRRAGSGGSAWTERVAEALDVSHRAADIHKRDCGIARVGPQRPDTDSQRDELAALILGALRRDLTDLAAEIKRSYEYVMRCYPGTQPGELILVGGGSLMRNLPEFLSDALGIRAACASDYLAETCCRIVHPDDRRYPLGLYAAAIGLAIPD